MRRICIILAAFIATSVLCGCGSTYIATANYDICYTDGTRTFEKSIKVTSYNKDISVNAYSVGGTNYVSVISKDNPFEKAKNRHHIDSSTAPIRLNSYTIEKCNTESVKDKKPYVW